MIRVPRIRSRKRTEVFCPPFASSHQSIGVPQQDTNNLSPRRRQVLTYLLQGEGEKRIAFVLKISVHTVHVHVREIYRTFNVHSRAELMALLLQPAGSDQQVPPQTKTGQGIGPRRQTRSQPEPSGRFSTALERTLSSGILCPPAVHG